MPRICIDSLLLGRDQEVVPAEPLQYWYSYLSITDTYPCFRFSVHPCFRLFHETHAMQVANSQHATTMQHASFCRLERESSVVAYLERQSSVVAFLLFTFNSSGITMVVLILEVVSKYEEHVRSMQKVPRFSHGRRLVRADGGPNRLFFCMLFIDHDMAIEFLKEIGLLRKTMHCESCGRDIPWSYCDHL